MNTNVLCRFSGTVVVQICDKYLGGTKRHREAQGVKTLYKFNGFVCQLRHKKGGKYPGGTEAQLHSKLHVILLWQSECILKIEPVRRLNWRRE